MIIRLGICSRQCCVPGIALILAGPVAKGVKMALAIQGQSCHLSDKRYRWSSLSTSSTHTRGFLSVAMTTCNHSGLLALAHRSGTARRWPP